MNAIRIERSILRDDGGPTSAVVEYRWGALLRSESDAIGPLPAMTTLWDFESQQGWVIEDKTRRVGPLSVEPRTASTTSRAMVAVDLGLDLDGEGSLEVPNPALQPITTEVPVAQYAGATVLAAVRVGDETHGIEMWVVEGLPLASTDYANAWRRRLPTPRTADEQRFIAELEALPGYPAVVRITRDNLTITSIVVSSAKVEVARRLFAVPDDYEQVANGLAILSAPKTAPSPSTDESAPHSNKAPRTEANWTEVSARQGDRLLFDEYFQDRTSVWRCEHQTCKVVHGADLGRELNIPCASDRVGPQPSPSGRWLLQACDQTVHVVDMKVGALQSTPISAPTIYSGVIDDTGTATVTIEGPQVARIERGKKLRHYSIDPPKYASGRFADHYPAVDPWLAYSDDAQIEDVAWRPGRPPAMTTLGRAVITAEGPHIWVENDDGFFKLAADGTLMPVRGKIRLGLPNKGMLISSEPWGAHGLVLEYEETILLVDSQLETVQTLSIPKMDGMLDVGSNPQGTQLHAASPYGALYIRAVPAASAKPASSPRR